MILRVDTHGLYTSRQVDTSHTRRRRDDIENDEGTEKTEPKGAKSERGIDAKVSLNKSEARTGVGGLWVTG